MLGGGAAVKIYPEIKQIAGKNDAIRRLGEKLSKKIGCDGFILESAYFVTGCTERGGHLYKDGKRLDQNGLVADQYYCTQYTGYCEDDYHGTLYFKTNVPGKFVAIPFEC